MKINRTCMIITIIICLFATELYLTQKNNHGFRVAIVQPAHHAAMDEIYEGFKQAITSGNVPITITRFNADNNKTLLRAQLEEIALKKYDGVMTIGSSATQMMYEINKKNDLVIPQVFTAVDSLESLGIFSNNTDLTGITISSDYYKQLELLQAIAPQAKKLLLAYDASKNPHLKSHVQNILAIAQNFGFEVNTYQISHQNEIIPVLNQPIQHADVAMILTDHTLVSGIEALRKLCIKYKVLLYASDSNSAQKGAAITYGVAEKEYGTMAGYAMMKIIQEDRTPPLQIITQKHPIVHRDSFEQQGGVLTPKLIDLIRKEGGHIL